MVTMKSIRELNFEIPVKVVSEANTRDHWAKRFRRQVDQKQATLAMMNQASRGRDVELPCVVKLIRIGAKALDSDNLANGFKAIRDSIAYRLAVDDGDIDKVSFEYSQIAIGKRDYRVRVEIRSE